MEAGVRDPWNPGEAFVPECPLCGGGLNRDRRETQALDWGVRTAASKPQSAFWDVMLVAETFRSAPPGNTPPDEEESDLSSLLRMGTQAVSSGELPGADALDYRVDSHSPMALDSPDLEHGSRHVPVVTLPDEPPSWLYTQGDGSVQSVVPVRLRDRSSWRSCCCFFQRIYKLP